MSSAIVSGISAFLGSLIGSVIVTPRADGSVVVTVKPLRFLYGKTVFVGTDPIQIIEKNARAVLIKADGGNTADVFIGNIAVNENMGYQLEKGEAVSFNVSNPEDIFLRAKSGVQKVHIIVLGE